MDRDWIADDFFSGGDTRTRTDDITNTMDDAIYQTLRFDASDFDYDVPVPSPGTYSLTLHFAESFYDMVGERVFNIDVENSQATVMNYDIIDAGGGMNNLAITLSFTDIDVTDGALTINFIVGTVDLPQVNGIEIIRTS